VKSQFVAQVVAWQQSLNLDNRAFARMLGRPESEWSMLRNARRQPSRSFLGTVLRLAPEPWNSFLQTTYLTDLKAQAQARAEERAA